MFAGIRNVDRRLIDMARVVGASEAAISREVIWNSLLPFFFAALKIALPRAVSAAIIGEFLVGNEGLGYLIEYSRQNFDTIGVFAGIVVATALVLVDQRRPGADRPPPQRLAAGRSGYGGLRQPHLRLSRGLPAPASGGPSPRSDGWIPRTSRGMTAGPFRLNHEARDHP